VSESSKLEAACMRHAIDVDRQVQRKSGGRQRMYCLLLWSTQGKVVFHANADKKQLAQTFRGLADQLDPIKRQPPTGESEASSDVVVTAAAGTDVVITPEQIEQEEAAGESAPVPQDVSEAVTMRP